MMVIAAAIPPQFLRKPFFFFIIAAGQYPAALGGKKIDFSEHDFDVLALLLQQRAAFLEFAQEFLDLFVLVLGQVVEFEQLPDIAQGKPQALAPQGELERIRSRLLNMRLAPSRRG